MAHPIPQTNFSHHPTDSPCPGCRAFGLRRIGYANPAEPWQEAPYQALTWPPGSDPLPTTSTLGAQVYAERCALCHGPTGQGDGAAAP
ncbi:MAG: cytochrome c, partial [Anaerolineae bacterium]|nr:cytochrome c [Anaerolineae bacterium]